MAKDSNAVHNARRNLAAAGLSFAPLQRRTALVLAAAACPVWAACPALAAECQVGWAACRVWAVISGE